MAVSCKNVAKFFDDHPELADRREGVMGKIEEDMAKIREAGGEGDLISGEIAEEALGDLAAQFIAEATTDPEHIKMGLASFPG